MPMHAVAQTRHGHTEAFDYRVMEHWGESQRDQFSGVTQTPKALSVHRPIC